MTNFAGQRFLSIVLAFVVGLATMQTMMLGTHSSLRAANHSPMAVVLEAQKHVTFSESKPVLRNPQQHYEQCRFYLAESAVAPNAGLGVFVGATGLLKGDMVGFPDICLFVHEPPAKFTHLHSHSWSGSTFLAQPGETSQRRHIHTRIACEGYGTIHNTMPKTHLNTRLNSHIQQTTGGIRRHEPAAGSSTHHYGVHGEALDIVPAGGELTIDYGDWEFDNKDYVGKKRPERPVEELERDGWCIDHLDIRPSTIPGAGRGAFVKRPLLQGDMVVPAPLQVMEDRAMFQFSKPEQLYVNYCLQPKGSTMIFYPYGPGVNLINHASDGREANVKLQWSQHAVHQANLLELNYDDFWEQVKPGKLILEFVAVRDLMAGEELLLDYGPVWEEAWKAHVNTWVPPKNANAWVYPEDMNDTDMLRTVKEQETKPYPPNLITMCTMPNWKRKGGSQTEWYDSGQQSWWWNVAYCHILEREMGKHGLWEYTVALADGPSAGNRYTENDLTYNKDKPFREYDVYTKVPRRGIHWVEKPYQDDEHLPNSFRQPIQFPAELVPSAWLNEKPHVNGNANE